MSSTRGRPRREGVEERILSATMSLLRARGYGGLRIDEVAVESGIAKTTIYRRWPTLVHLVAATMADALDREPIALVGHLEEDLDTVIGDRAAGLAADGSLVAVALDIHRQSDPELRAAYRARIIDPVRDRMVAALVAAQHKGEVDADADPSALADAVIGGLFYRAAVLGEPLTVDAARRFWRTVVPRS